MTLTLDPGDAAAYRAAGWWGEETVATRVARNRAERPTATAFVDADSRMTWEEYDAHGSALAGALVDTGVEPGDRIAVQLPDTAVVHVAFLACEKAGATVVGIGARAGERETRHLIEHTGATIMVTLDDVQRLERMDDAGAAARIAGRALAPDDVFMLNSTSGTTGLPKVVAHTQNRWFYFHQLAVDAGRLTSADVFSSLIRRRSGSACGPHTSPPRSSAHRAPSSPGSRPPTRSISSSASG